MKKGDEMTEEEEEKRATYGVVRGEMKPDRC